MDLVTSISLIQKLIALAILLQSIELLQLRSIFSDTGVWRWQDLKDEFKIFSKPTQKLFSFCLSYKNFLILLLLRLILSICLLFEANLLILSLLLFSAIMICLRWRGVFNGGSDYMTVLVLAALLIQKLFPDSEKIAIGILWYLTIQLISSYFIAGFVKLKAKNWRNGNALRGFISSTIYSDNLVTNQIIKNKSITIILSWMLIVFELTFPLTLINPRVSLCYLMLAAFFHLGNFYIFGLNRFIFAWISCYPALYFCSGF